jgi:hypothetical protein
MMYSSGQRQSLERLDVPKVALHRERYVPGLPPRSAQNPPKVEAIVSLKY